METVQDWEETWKPWAPVGKGEGRAPAGLPGDPTKERNNTGNPKIGAWRSGTLQSEAVKPVLHSESRDQKNHA